MSECTSSASQPATLCWFPINKTNFPDFENKVHLSGGAQPPIQAGGVVHLVDTLQDTEAGLVAQAQSGKLEAFEWLVTTAS